MTSAAYDDGVMAELFANSDDSLYLDVTAGDRSPVRMAEVAGGVLLHVDEAGVLVAIEVMDLSQRGGLVVGVDPEADSLYLDVTAGSRSPVRMAEVAEGVSLHVDEAGALVAIEVLDLSQRGGLRVDDLDAPPGAARPAVFTDIERAAANARGSYRLDGRSIVDRGVG